MKRIILISLLTLMVSSCAFLDIMKPGTEVSRVEQGSIPVSSELTTISIGFSSKLKIVRTAGTSINYNLVKKVQAASLKKGEEALDVMNFQNSGQSITMTSPKIDQFYIYEASLEGTMEIPEAITIIRLECESGGLDIDATGVILKELNLKVTSGGLKANGFSLLTNGTLFFSTVSGGIDVHAIKVGKNANVRVEATSGSAKINIDELDSCVASGKIVSGGLHFINKLMKGSTLDFEVTSGGVNFDSDKILGVGSFITLRTTSGGINFTTYTGNSIHYDLEATSGGIWIDDKYGKDNGFDEDVDFTMNGGGNTVKIRSTSGGITLD